MEATYTNQVKVGIFIFAGLIAIGLSIFFLGGSDALKTQYTLKVKFPSIQGLAEGSVVSLTGVVIGTVKQIEFAEDSNDIVLTLKIMESFKPRITKGSTADIRTQGALGDKFIYIESNKESKEALEDGGYLGQAQSNDIISVLTKDGDRASKIFDILDNVELLTKTFVHEGRMDRILSSFERSSQNLESTLAEARKLMSDVRGNGESDSKMSKSMEKLDRILGRIDRGEGSLGALINDSSLHDQLKSVLGGNRRSQNMRELMRKSIEDKN